MTVTAKNNNLDLDSEEEVKLGLVVETLYRRKNIVSFFAAIGFLLSGFNAFNTKRLWQGEFQIVLPQSNASSFSMFQKEIQAFSSLLNKNSTKLGTQVEILKSPSVLMSVFEFVKEKKKSTSNEYENMRFSEWRDNLNIEVTKGTSILNISYKDNNKNLVLPVLNNIANLYREYSTKKRSKSLEDGRKNILNQINIYKDKSINSIKEVYVYASKNDMLNLPADGSHWGYKGYDKYMQLQSEANRNKFILNNLEQNYTGILLNNSFMLQPWELITSPTMLPNPVSRNTAFKLFRGLLLGLFSGSVISLIYEKRKGLVYSFKEIESSLNWPLLDIIDLKDKKSVETSIKLLACGIQNDIQEEILILKIGFKNNIDLKDLLRFFNEYFKFKKVVFTDDFTVALKYKDIIVLLAEGETPKQDLYEKHRKLIQYKKLVKGFLFLKNNC